MIEEYRKALSHAGCDVIVATVQERLSEAELLPLIGEVDGIICGDDQLTERVLAQAPRLQVISKWGTGIDSIDLEAASRHGITVCNTPNAFSEPVADTVFGYVLAFARKPDLMNRDIRQGLWRKPQLTALNETTLGIIGVGNCGRAVARRARAFGMRLVGCDPVTPPDDFLASTGMAMATQAELLKCADFVTLHTTLNPTSYHLIDREALRLMKPNAVLINTSRGPVVDEGALVEALEAGRIAGAALDVFETEPLPSDSPLRQLETALLAPHNANSSPRAAEHVHENTIRNLLEHLALRTPR
ncbi:MAG TPA: phosphoglycerate dehydrogenase [Chloroflexota bacterium]|nr:phosphoglycerate dehydrogenase [Chloroflexota bacterium]